MGIFSHARGNFPPGLIMLSADAVVGLVYRETISCTAATDFDAADSGCSICDSPAVVAGCKASLSIWLAYIAGPRGVANPRHDNTDLLFWLGGVAKPRSQDDRTGAIDRCNERKVSVYVWQCLD